MQSKRTIVMKLAFEDGIRDSSRVILSLLEHIPEITAISGTIITALKRGNKILIAGNGGSAAEAMHMAEELIGRFRSNRRSLPAIALAADGTALTCIGNDFGFEAIFSRQVEGLGKPGDILVVFSTSGNSPNIESAVAVAKKLKMKTICVLGKGGGVLTGHGDHEIIIGSKATERIQEAHQALIHLILNAVEEAYA